MPPIVLLSVECAWGDPATLNDASVKSAWLDPETLNDASVQDISKSIHKKLTKPMKLYLKRSQDASESPQEASKRLRTPPRCLQERPKRPSRASKGSPTACKRHPEDLQEASKSFQKLPKTPFSARERLPGQSYHNLGSDMTVSIPPKAAPRTPPGSPREPPELPGISRGAPMTLQGSPRRPLSLQNGPPGPPRGLPELPKASKNAF